jgi:hypothetical protein
MDIQSPKHLERFRDQPEIKAVLLRSFLSATANEARFERAAKNSLYWPPIDNLESRILLNNHIVEVQEAHQIYGRPCWLLGTSLTSSPNAPFLIAIVAADGTPVTALLTLLNEVSHDYWYGSTFFK